MKKSRILLVLQMYPMFSQTGNFNTDFGNTWSPGPEHIHTDHNNRNDGHNGKKEHNISKYQV